MEIKKILNKKTKYTTRKDSFILTARIILFFSIAAVIVYTFFLKDVSRVVVYNLYATILICAILLPIAKRVKNIRVLSLILMLYIFFCLMPVYILYGDENKSATPIWYAASIMVAIYLLELKDIWWVFIISSYFSMYLYTYVYIWNESDTVINDRGGFYIGFAFSFLAIAVAISYILIKMERNFKVAETEIDKSHEIEINAGLAKSRFLANMSHEIRTPMNSIIGLSELVLKDEMDNSTRDAVSIIKKSAYDLLEIIDDVLMFSKLDSQKFKMVEVDFKFDTLLKSVIDTVSENITDKDIKVRIRVDHNIPKVLHGDDIRIKQVILRLIFIALSLTDNGRLMLEFKAAKEDNSDKVRIHCIISDTGCGLSSVDLDAIFGVYDTYDSRQNSNLKGIGLKYNICREILKLMDGTMDIKSIEGVGLESEISFVCDVINSDPMISLSDNSPKKVLIYVRDNRELDSWKSIMEGFKIRPDYVNSYFAFDKALQNTKYDFVFVTSETVHSLMNVIEIYNIFDNTYVICNKDNSYGDFGKCRITRHPVSSLSIVNILNNNWKAEDYISKNDNIEYDGSAAKVLVVDDSAVNLKVAAGIFRSYKIEIDLAKSGEEALNKMSSRDYDLVFLDMVMPEMSGTETLKKMRSFDNDMMKNVPVVALTANTGGNIREEVLNDGFQEYLAKPIKQRYLTQTLLAFLPPGTLKRVVKGKEEGNNSVAIGNALSVSNDSNALNGTEDSVVKLIDSLKANLATLNIEECDKTIDEMSRLNIKGAVGLKLEEVFRAYNIYDFKKINEVIGSL